MKESTMKTIDENEVKTIVRKGVYRLDADGYATTVFYEEGEPYVIHGDDILKVVKVDNILEEQKKIKTFVYDESGKLLFVREQGFEYGIRDREAGIISGFCIDTTYYPYTDEYGYGQPDSYKRFMVMGITKYYLRREVRRIKDGTKIETEYEGKVIRREEITRSDGNKIETKYDEEGFIRDSTVISNNGYTERMKYYWYYNPRTARWFMRTAMEVIK